MCNPCDSSEKHWPCTALKVSVHTSATWLRWTTPEFREPNIKHMQMISNYPHITSSTYFLGNSCYDNTKCPTHPPADIGEIVNVSFTCTSSYKDSFESEPTPWETPQQTIWQCSVCPSDTWSFIFFPFTSLKWFISFANIMKANGTDAMSIDGLPWRNTAEVKGDVPEARSVVRTRVWRTGIEWVVSITWQEAKMNMQTYEKRGEEILVQHS